MGTVKKTYTSKDKKLSFTLRNDQINGIYGTNVDDILNIIFEQEKGHKVSYIREWIREDIHELTVREQLTEYMKRMEIYPKNLEKKLKDSLKIVGLEESLLNSNIYSLSTSEQKKIQLAEELLNNPEIIILEEPLKVLDIKNRKKITMVLKKLKDQYQKTIIIVTNNPDDLLKETEHLIIYKNKKILIDEETKDAYQRVEFLKKHKVEIPEIIDFTYMAKKDKNVRIDYWTDIRDLIKDIYKHV